jgi:hypothetical protein
MAAWRAPYRSDRVGDGRGVEQIPRAIIRAPYASGPWNTHPVL